MRFVEKGGEIIPKVTGGIHQTTQEVSPHLYHPLPGMQYGAGAEEDQANHYCPNEKGCPPQNQRQD